jgi:hypothetical protein
MSPTDAPRELLAPAGKDGKAAWILARAADPQMDAAGSHLQQMVARTSPNSKKSLNWSANSWPTSSLFRQSADDLDFPMTSVPAHGVSLHSQHAGM